MWREAAEQVATCSRWTRTRAYEGKYFSMPCRNVVPKPVQKPHPPLWVACSNRDTIHLAAQLGIGALTFAFVDPAEARHWVDDYYETFKRECVPIGHAVNPNIAMVTGFSVPRGRAGGASRAGSRASASSASRSAHHYIFGEPQARAAPTSGRRFEKVRHAAARHGPRAASARPTQLRAAPAPASRRPASTR